MYQYDILCTYQLIDDYELSEYLYRIQFLQIFGINQTNQTNQEIIDAESKIEGIITSIFTDISNNAEYKIIESKAKLNIAINDILLACNSISEGTTDELVFRLLFNYDFFHIFHRCISDFLLHGTISSKNLENLITTI